MSTSSTSGMQWLLTVCSSLLLVDILSTESSDFESLTNAVFTISTTTPLGSTVCYTITITGDNVQEVNEMFTVTVSTVNNLDQIVGADTVTVTILQNSEFDCESFFFLFLESHFQLHKVGC